MTLENHIRTLGRGPGRSRSLTQDEAFEAMQCVLDGAAPEAVGALLMLLRMKGETAEEIAGFVSATQSKIPKVSGVALDWPSYAAGRTRGLPWFLLSAKLVAMAGYPVLLHGWNGADQAVRKGLVPAGIETAKSPQDATTLIRDNGIAYLPLEVMSDDIFALLNLRQVLGLRSCINTVARMLNPGRAPCSVQGVFHPSYRLLQADAATLMGWTSLSVIKGGGGEFERHPSKAIAAFGLRCKKSWQDDFPAMTDDSKRLTEVSDRREDLSDLWTDKIHNPFAKAIVVGTAALALDTLGVSSPEQAAQNLWTSRNLASAT
ncbi:MAG: glycosyl transferase family protein [Paracoccaceae bacterium]